MNQNTFTALYQSHIAHCISQNSDFIELIVTVEFATYKNTL